jgi:hypothetical protein
MSPSVIDISESNAWNIGADAARIRVNFIFFSFRVIEVRIFELHVGDFRRRFVTFPVVSERTR